MDNIVGYKSVILRRKKLPGKLVTITTHFLVFNHAINKLLNSFSKFSRTILEKVKETMDELDKTKKPIIREFVLRDKLGIDTLPAQLMRKRIEEGFIFNLLLVGETGIGKSTLACSLFNIPLCTSSSENHISPEVKLKSVIHKVCEKSVNVKLTVVETVGYGDQVNRENNARPIIQYIESQFEMYFQEELKTKRSLSSYKDTRIHACLYFICPTGHNLKSLDVFCMKQLQDKVNLIPIIAKSDTLSGDELARFKKNIRETIERQNINIYFFPTDDKELGHSNSESNCLIPFAVSASRDYVPVEGRLARARTFPWGTMVVENDNHSEFSALKHALIEVNMEDMRDKTNDKFYEAYRRTRLLQLGCNISEQETLTTYELLERLRKKQQKEMLEEEKRLKEVFAAKVRSKDEELKSLENSMNSKYNVLFEQLKNEQEYLNRQKNKLDLEIFAVKSGKQQKKSSKSKK